MRLETIAALLLLLCSCAAGAGKYVGSAEADRAALERARAAVDKVRKSDAVVLVLGPGGKPVAGAEVVVRQRESDFKVGCNIFGFDRFATAAQNEEYKRRFAEIFDFATLPFYWKSYEPVRGQPQHAYREKVARWCAEHGIVTKGHPLAWTHPAGVPDWTKNLNPLESLAELERRVRECVAHFAGLIDIWDVVNEPTHTKNWPGTKDRVDYVERALRWAHEANPNATLVVNEYYVIQDMEGRGPFFNLVRELLRRGAPIGAIGMQCHEPRSDWYPLDMVEKTLAAYAQLGLPIQITEFTPTSSGKPITGNYRQGTWTEQAQADYAEQFLRICFAQPAVRAVIWWDLCEAKAWLPGGGLLDKQLRPKEIFRRVKKLVREEWRTNITLRTDANGRAKFRGFHGAYTITARHGGRSAAATGRIRPGETAQFTLRLR